ncbi:MAG TPA: response regulator transcription factor [Dissulfurispiraceae bacterium]|nr:response regulator transcription factor [Dissulfurispiraceae bacterium]
MGEKKKVDGGSGTMTCVAIHLANALMGDALKNYLSAHLEKYLVLTHNELITSGMNPDLLIVDDRSINDGCTKRHPMARTIVVDTGLSRADVVRILSLYPISGIVGADSDLPIFAKAIRIVMAGELWVGRDIMKAFVEAYGARRGTTGGHDILSTREREVVSYVCDGMTNKEIANTLKLSEQTIKAHLNRVFKKLNVTNRSQLVSVVSESRILR